MESKWIKVTDKLPKPNKEGFTDDVLVCGKRIKNNSIKICIANYNNHLKLWDSNFHRHSGITHWMPLPESPDDI